MTKRSLRQESEWTSDSSCMSQIEMVNMFHELKKAYEEEFEKGQMKVTF